MTIEELRSWCNRMLSDAPELSMDMRSLWVKQGKMRCRNCRRPIYLDNGPGNSSGYYFHAGHGAVDGKNGLYCNPSAWFGGPQTSAFPDSPAVKDEDIASLVLTLLPPVDSV